MRRHRFDVDRARAGALLAKLQGQTKDLVEQALVAAERQPDSTSSAHQVGSAVDAVRAHDLLREYAAALGTSEATVRDCASVTTWPEAGFQEVVADLGWSRAVAIGRVGRLAGAEGAEACGVQRNSFRFDVT